MDNNILNKKYFMDELSYKKTNLKFVKEIKNIIQNLKSNVLPKTFLDQILQNQKLIEINKEIDNGITSSMDSLYLGLSDNFDGMETKEEAMDQVNHMISYMEGQINYINDIIY